MVSGEGSGGPQVLRKLWGAKEQCSVSFPGRALGEIGNP